MFAVFEIWAQCQPLSKFQAIMKKISSLRAIAVTQRYLCDSLLFQRCPGQRSAFLSAVLDRTLPIAKIHSLLGKVRTFGFELYTQLHNARKTRDAVVPFNSLKHL